MNGGVYRASHICPHCLFEHEGGRHTRRGARLAETTALERAATEPAVSVLASVASEVPQQEPAPIQLSAVVLTSKSNDELTILEVIDDLTAEYVQNIQLTPDLFKDGKFVGSKSEKVKAALNLGKKHVLAQLRKAAQGQGANMVTNVTVKNTIKAVGSQKANITVRGGGTSVRAELAQETCEA